MDTVEQRKFQATIKSTVLRCARRFAIFAARNQLGLFAGSPLQGARGGVDRLIPFFLPFIDRNITTIELVSLRTILIASLYQQERNIQILRTNRPNPEKQQYPNPVEIQTNHIR